MDDLVTLAVLASSAFFVVLAFGLLLRYRQVSQRVNASTDLGHDLWAALEQRMKKQDERILDMMGRFEVIQSRYSAAPVPPVARPVTRKVAVEEKQALPMEEKAVPSQPTSQVTATITPEVTAEITLDKTEISILKHLSTKPRSPVEIKDLIETSREHAARLMKNLFDEGLVTRDSSKKPFVYHLTESGKRYLSDA